MASEFVGSMLKDHLMAGIPVRAGSYGDYRGIAIEPCGEYAPDPTSLESPPWLHDPGSHFGTFQRLSLHREVQHFISWSLPSTTETLVRQGVVSRFEDLLKKLEPEFAVRTLASSMNGLDLPTDDIEMVLMAGETSAYLSNADLAREHLVKLAPKIRSSGFAAKVDSALQTSVPSLRITDAVTGLDIELTASGDQGVGSKAARLVHDWTTRDTLDADMKFLARTMTSVLKLFLATRRLGSASTGGVSNYMLVWMVVAWVELELPRMLLKSTGPPMKDPGYARAVEDINNGASFLSTVEKIMRSERHVDLGDALKAFLKFYGEDFDTTTATILFGPKTVKYGAKPSQSSQQRYLLSITDPVDSSVDVGANAYAIKHVLETFREGYHLLNGLDNGTASRTYLVKAKVQGTLGCLLGGDYSKLKAKRQGIVRR